eukprot:366326-Chlamydomonas_euryale.AAC.8
MRNAAHTAASLASVPHPDSLTTGLEAPKMVPCALATPHTLLLAWHSCRIPIAERRAWKPNKMIPCTLAPPHTLPLAWRLCRTPTAERRAA